MPLARRRYRGLRLLEWSGARVTDYGDALLDPAADARRLLQGLWGAVRARGGFDVARLGQVRLDAACTPLVAGLQHWVETRECSYVLPIRGAAVRDWLEGRSGNLRKDLRRRARRAAEAGLEFWAWSPGEPWRPALDALVAQKRARIAAGIERGVLATEAGMAFVHALAEATAERGWLHLCALRADGAFAAYDFGFLKEGVLYSYLASYDPAWASLGPGQVLLARMVALCHERGLRALDLLLSEGDEKVPFGCE